MTLAKLNSLINQKQMLDIEIDLTVSSLNSLCFEILSQMSDSDRLALNGSKYDAIKAVRPFVNSMDEAKGFVEWYSLRRLKYV